MSDFNGSFIQDFFLRKININPNKTVFEPDGGQFAKSQKIVPALSIKRSDEKTINLPKASIILMICFFFKSHIESYTCNVPVVYYQNTVDYILERNPMPTD